MTIPTAPSKNQHQQQDPSLGKCGGLLHHIPSTRHVLRTGLGLVLVVVAIRTPLFGGKPPAMTVTTTLSITRHVSYFDHGQISNSTNNDTNTSTSKLSSSTLSSSSSNNNVVASISSIISSNNPPQEMVPWIDECASLVDDDDNDNDDEMCQGSCRPGLQCARSCCYQQRCQSAFDALQSHGVVLHRGFHCEAVLVPWRGHDVILKRPIPRALWSWGQPHEVVNQDFVDNKYQEEWPIITFLNNSQPQFVHVYGECVGNHFPWREQQDKLYTFFIQQGGLLAVSAGLKRSKSTDKQTNQTVSETRQMNASNASLVNETTSLHVTTNTTNNTTKPPLKSLVKFYAPFPWCHRIQAARELQQVVQWFNETGLQHKDWGIHQLALDHDGHVKVIDLGISTRAHNESADSHKFMLSSMIEKPYWQCEKHLPASAQLDFLTCEMLFYTMERWKRSYGVQKWYGHDLNEVLQDAGVDGGLDDSRYHACLAAGTPVLQKAIHKLYMQDIKSASKRCTNTPLKFPERKWLLGKFRPC